MHEMSSGEVAMYMLHVLLTPGKELVSGLSRKPEALMTKT